MFVDLLVAVMRMRSDLETVGAKVKGVKDPPLASWPILIVVESKMRLIPNT